MAGSTTGIPNSRLEKSIELMIYVSVSSGTWLLEVRGVVLQFRPLEIWALYKTLYGVLK